MIVNELPKDTYFADIKVKLPADVLKQYKDYCGGEPEMWIVGDLMGDFFLSPDPPRPEHRKLYPMPPGVLPSDILEWEVADVLKTKKEDQ